MTHQPPPFQPDKTFNSAIEEAQRDYARLLLGHSPSWSVNLSGSLIWRCSCTETVPRNTAAMETHILTAIKNARGPVRRAK